MTLLPQKKSNNPNSLSMIEPLSSNRNRHLYTASRAENPRVTWPSARPSGVCSVKLALVVFSLRPDDRSHETNCVSVDPTLLYTVFDFASCSAMYCGRRDKSCLRIYLRLWGWCFFFVLLIFLLCSRIVWLLEIWRLKRWKDLVILLR